MQQQSVFFSRLWRIARYAAAGLGLTVSASAFALTSFSSTYSACSGKTYKLSGQEPDASGKYPVFVYLVGTNESYTNAAAMAAIKGMAERGFVSATVEYANGAPITCSGQSPKAQCIFNQSNSNSAISKICARGKADCSKGIVLGGLSQGAITSVLAKNYNPNVRAVYGMGILARYMVTDMSSCLAPANRSLPADKLRANNGESDEFGGGLAPLVRTNTQNVTGLSCGSTAYSCYRANGSGWAIVKNSQVSDFKADHCYVRSGGGCIFGSQNYNDANWAGSSGANWTLNANLDWLKNQATP